ncbi:MAG TPA: sterol carrier family protein [Dermatophilaceae bacterium]|nr:sterol carrier family protein [Dermatophilaceae bacterium]
MPSRRRVPPAAGRAAVAAWLADPAGAPAEEVARAVRFTLEELAARAPGRSTEVRVPPIGAVQCVAGLTHRRGTPPNVVETDAATWLELATGVLGWDAAFDAGRLQVSGTRADLTAYLPLAGHAHEGSRA